MTKRRPRRSPTEGFKVFRVAMVLSSLSPLFVLWAIRGIPMIPDIWFIPICMALALIPTAFVYCRISNARANREKRQLSVGAYEDSRQYLLVYLFANLLPFYRTDFVGYRDLGAMVLALAVIVFLFWHLRLHYVNVLFAVLNYRAFTIHPPRDGSPYTGTEPIVLLSTRHHLNEGENINAYRITDSVYLEPGDESSF